MDFTVTFLSNSGFVLETGKTAFVIDYQGDCPGIVNQTLLEKGKNLLFMASHGHGDHFSRRIFDFAGLPNTAFLLSSDIRTSQSGVVFLSPHEKLALFDAEITAYESTDMGVSFLIEVEGRRIFHAGDLNCWHWADESTQEEVDEAKRMFARAIAEIPGDIDMAFFPVDPRLGMRYDLGADIFLERFAPKLFFPMHFRESTHAAYDFEKKHRQDGLATKIIPLVRAGEKYGGSI